EFARQAPLEDGVPEASTNSSYSYPFMCIRGQISYPKPKCRDFHEARLFPQHRARRLEIAKRALITELVRFLEMGKRVGDPAFSRQGRAPTVLRRRIRRIDS